MSHLSRLCRISARERKEKKEMNKKFLAMLLVFTMVFSFATNAFAGGGSASGNASGVNEYGQAYVCLGADLNQDQYKSVLNLLGVTEDELVDYVQIEVTNEEEHKYLDNYLDPSVIGRKAMSSLKMIPREEGAGLHIVTYNINYCTVAMYQNALITAGVEDADVVIAGPFDLSGTAALIGVVKAYCDSKGIDIDEDALFVAANELCLTSELGDIMGDPDKVASLLAYAKQLVISEDLSSKSEIRKAVRQAADEMDFELTDDQVEQIVDLMKKISALDIDPEALAKQATEIYNGLKAMGIDLDDMDVNGFLEWIKNFFQQILDFLSSLFE